MGSHLLSNALTSTGLAGRPREWLPRFTEHSIPATPKDRMRLVAKPPQEVRDDPEADARYIEAMFSTRTTDNGVFGVVIHWPVMGDAVRRFGTFLGTDESAPHGVLSAALPNLSYVWLRRRDKVAQAVSWYKAIQTGVYVRPNGGGATRSEEVLRFDAAKIRYLRSALTSFENAWTSYFAAEDLSPLVLHYEDLSSAYDSTVRSVLDFLGLAGAKARIDPPKHAKYADGLSREWIERFTALENGGRRRP